MRTRWILFGLLAACSDGSSEPDPPDDPGNVDAQMGACTAFEGRRFESVDKHECGITPDGVAMCFWHLDLAPIDPQRSRYSWQHSDVGENGSVRCTGRNILTDGFGRVYSGAYDPATFILTWDSLPYRLL